MFSLIIWLAYLFYNAGFSHSIKIDVGAIVQNSLVTGMVESNGSLIVYGGQNKLEKNSDGYYETNTFLLSYKDDSIINYNIFTNSVPNFLEAKEGFIVLGLAYDVGTKNQRFEIKELKNNLNTWRDLYCLNGSLRGCRIFNNEKIYISINQDLFSLSKHENWNSKLIELPKGSKEFLNKSSDNNIIFLSNDTSLYRVNSVIELYKIDSLGQIYLIGVFENDIYGVINIGDEEYIIISRSTDHGNHVILSKYYKGQLTLLKKYENMLFDKIIVDKDLVYLLLSEVAGFSFHKRHLFMLNLNKDSIEGSQEIELGPEKLTSLLLTSDNSAYSLDTMNKIRKFLVKR